MTYLRLQGVDRKDNHETRGPSAATKGGQGKVAAVRERAGTVDRPPPGPSAHGPHVQAAPLYVPDRTFA